MNKDAAYESGYNPRLAVPEFARHFARWTENSAKVRKDLSPYLDVPYGSGPLEKLDLFRSKGPSRGLLMFIHGGYWRALDKSQHSFVAAPFVQAGITVATINYALCPAVTVADIVRRYSTPARFPHLRSGAPDHKLHVPGPAGGHLTAMVLAAQWPASLSICRPKLCRGTRNQRSIRCVADRAHSID
jgi:arylformamidase